MIMKSNVNVFCDCGWCLTREKTPTSLFKRKWNRKTVFYSARNRRITDIGAWLVIGEYSISWVCCFELMSFSSNETSSSNYRIEGKVLPSWVQDPRHVSVTYQKKLYFEEQITDEAFCNVKIWGRLCLVNSLFL